jgi:hypothetical protein
MMKGALLGLLLAAGGAGILFQATFRASGTGAADRSAMAKLRDVVSVKDFGALCDGSTNDRDAIVNAHTAAVAQGASVLINCKMHITSAIGTVTAPLKFEGTGALDFLTAGGSITINGPILAPISQIFFIGLGQGIITFGKKIPLAYPQWFGAAGDGATDDTTAIGATQHAMNSAGGGVVFFPAGTYIVSGVGILNRADKTILRGAGARLSIIKTLTSITALYQTSGALPGRVTEAFEDLTFDQNKLAQGIIHGGATASRLTVRRCRFINIATAGIGMTNPSNVTIEDSEFFEGVKPTSTGISISGGASDIKIRRNRFEYLTNGIIIDNGNGAGDFEKLAEKVVIADNYFDLAWWLIGSTTFTNSGGTVTYTATVLTDSAANFTGLVAGAGNNIRILPVRRTGTIASTDNQTLTDSTGSFIADGVLRGEIVRSGTKYAVIDGVESATILRLENWRDSTTAEPTTPPAAASSYTAYKVVIGRNNSFTSTTITTDRWHDLAGNSVTPSAGDLYEVLNARPNYPFNAEQGTRDLIVSGNIFRRGWSDQISTFGTRAQILNNQIEDGQDMGVTLHGDHNILSGNRIYHQGSGGIYCTCSDTLISNNNVLASQWQNVVNTLSLGGINVDIGSAHVQIDGNLVDGESQPQAHFGIVVNASGGATDDITLALNRARRHGTSDYRVYGAVTNLKLRDNDGTYSHANGAVGVDYVMYGTGTPESNYTAGVGSLFRRTDGAGGTVLYVKATGTGNTGWTTATPQTGTITLSAGTGTATVVAASGCTCTDTTANASVKCAVAATTLTATGTGTDVIRYQCFF